jgi:hypothetical protein
MIMLCHKNTCCNFFQIKMIKEIIAYEQPFRTDDEMPRNYYDPNIMLAEQCFCLRPNDEIVIVINGKGYRFSDDIIFTLELPPHSQEEEGTENSSENPELVPSSFSPKQLCLFIKNTSSQYSIYVGYKSPLSWLLDMPRCYSKLCYCSIMDLSKLRMSINHNLNNDDDDLDDNFKADANTICVREYSR